MLLVSLYSFVCSLRQPSPVVAVVDGVLRAYEQFVKPAFDEFVLPTKRHADVVVPRGAENAVAIDLLVRGIRERTLEREVASSRPPPRVIVAP